MPNQYDIPDTFNTPAELGEWWWNLSNIDPLYGMEGSGGNTGTNPETEYGAYQSEEYPGIGNVPYWNQQQSYGANMWSTLMDPHFYEAGDPDNVINPYTFALQNYHSFLPYDVDRGEVYRAQASGEIGEDLLRSRYRSQDVSDLNRRIGSTGFASSGIRQNQNLYDRFSSDYNEIQQETQAATTDVYSSFGSSLQAAMGDAGASGAFDVEGALYEDIGESYDFSSFGLDEDATFQEGLEACFDQYFIDQIDNYAEGGQYGPAQFIQAAQWCAENYGTGV